MRNTRESDSCPYPEPRVIQRTRAKAKTGKVATSMHKIKRLVTFGSPAWADQPGNVSCPTWNSVLAGGNQMRFVIQRTGLTVHGKTTQE